MSVNSMMFDFIKSVFHKIRGQETNTKQRYTLPFQQINFDFKSLCPDTVVSIEDQIEWLKAYLEHVSKNSVLLWADDKVQLNIFFKNEITKNFHHVILPAYTVNSETKQISLKIATAALTDTLLQDALNNIHTNLPNSHYVPSELELKKKKFEIHIAKSAITKELCNVIERDTSRALENIEQCNECVVCLEKYTEESPPVITQSGFVFHKKCIDDHLRTQHNQGIDLTCPHTGTLLFSRPPGQQVPVNLDSFTHPDLSYKAMLENATELAASLKIMQSIQTALVEENQKLKAMLGSLSRSNNNPTAPEESQLVVSPRP